MKPHILNTIYLVIYRSEKNATPWSKDSLKSLLESIEFDDGTITGRVKKLSKCEGEATANNRKAKLIFFYEWELEMKWECEFDGVSWIVQVIENFCGIIVT